MLPFVKKKKTLGYDFLKKVRLLGMADVRGRGVLWVIRLNRGGVSHEEWHKGGVGSQCPSGLLCPVFIGLIDVRYVTPG